MDVYGRVACGVCVALVCVAVCGDGDHPDGGLTGDLCFEGHRDVTWLPMVPNGTKTVRVGRLRQHTRVQGPSLFSGSNVVSTYGGTCDVSEPVEIRDIDVEMYEGSGLRARVVDGRLRVTSEGESRGDVHLETSAGSIKFATAVPNLARAFVDYVGAFGYSGDEVRVTAGSRLTLDIDYVWGGKLVGDFDWVRPVPWAREDTMIYINEESRESMSKWEVLHGVRVTDEIGEVTYDFFGSDDGFIVEDPGVVERLEFCKSVCKRGGSALGIPFTSGSGSERRLEFLVVFRDSEGRQVLGLPDDFEVKAPEGWRDVRDPVQKFGGTRWVFAPPEGGVLEGEVEVRAYGLTATVTAKPE